MSIFQWLDTLCGMDRQPAVRVPDGPPAPPVRRRYRFFGLVQGVGFRYEARSIASQLDLTGWVRNEADGSVTAEVQGRANYVGAFLLAVRAVPRFDITDVQTEDLPLSRGETSFRILY